MSRLIEKLKQSREKKPQPLGFLTSTASVEKARLQIIAFSKIESPDTDIPSADAVVIPVSKKEQLERLEEACKDKKAIPSGGWIDASSNSLQKKIMEADCDFFIFPDSVPMTIIPEDKVGRILELDADLSDILLRTISELPVDAVLVDLEEEKSIKLNTMMKLQRIISLTGTHVLLKVSTVYQQQELQALWDMGICGLVVDISTDKSKPAELRKLIDKLKTTKPKKKEKLSPVLPQVSGQAAEAEEEEEEEEEEE